MLELVAIVADVRVVRRRSRLGYVSTAALRLRTVIGWMRATLRLFMGGGQTVNLQAG